MEVLLNVAICVTWGLPVLIVGLIFAFRGAKRGTVPALISVGSTLVAAGLSWLIAHLIGNILGTGVTKYFNMVSSLSDLLGDYIPFDLSAFGASATIVQLLDAIIKGFVALAIFGVVMLINSIIIKCVVSSIVTKKVSFPGKFSWGGFFISLFDAILLVSLILLPGNGTLGMIRDVTPVIETITDATTIDYLDDSDASLTSAPADTVLSDDYDDSDFLGSDSASSDTDVLAILKSVSKNPIVVIYDIQPLSGVYDSLFMGTVNGSSFSPSKFVRGTCDVTSETITLFTRGNVTFDKTTEELAKDYIDYTDSNKALKPLLNDIVNSIIGVVDTSDSLRGETEEDDDTFIQILRIFQSTINKLLTEESSDKTSRCESVEMMLVGAARLVNAVSDPDILSGSDLKAIEPIFTALGDVLEGLARHPLIGADGIMDIYTKLIKVVDTDGTFSALTSESAISSLRDALKTAVTKDMEDEFFADFLSTLIDTVVAFASSAEDGNIDMSKLLTADDAVLDTISSLVSADTLEGFGLDSETAEKASGIVTAVVDTIKAVDLTEEEAAAEGELLGAIMNAAMNDGEISEELQDALKDSQIINALAENEELDEEMRKMLQDFLGK